MAFESALEHTVGVLQREYDADIAAMNARIMELERENINLTDEMGSMRDFEAAIERDHYTHDVRGRVNIERVDRVELHGCFCQCTGCGDIKPLSLFGMLTDKTRNAVRNQPRCRKCRAQRTERKAS